MDDTKQPGIRIGQIFLGRTTFEYASDPLILPPNTGITEANTLTNVTVGMDEAEKIGVVTLTISSAPDSASPYRFQLEIIGVVERATDDAMELREYLAKAGPATLYPFAREAIANLTMRGRFGPIWLGPMNFTEIGEQLSAAFKEQSKEKQNPVP
jgi:preprotein translocase subunit SecB